MKVRALRAFLLTALIAATIDLGAGRAGAVSTGATHTQLDPGERPPGEFRTAIFYYPWYHNPDVDGAWFHWDPKDGAPPADIASDYYPLLGAYSVNDPAVVEQHCAWLRERGIRVLIASWWGPGSNEDRAIPALLDAAAKHGVYVAFHIEPYDGRSAETLPADIAYLKERYGSHPAFFRTAARAPFGKTGVTRGVFFLWGVGFDLGGRQVPPSYWREANDRIHAAGDGAVMIAEDTNAAFVTEGGFDGLYSYATLTADDPALFAWGNGVPLGAWFIPSVIPGFSARRIGYDPKTYVPRNAGQTFRYQWERVLAGAVEPNMVAITSFNEWHEGTQIEPARDGDFPAGPRIYESYRPLSPESYLDLAGEYAARFQAQRWPAMVRVRMEITTTSDWTTIRLLSGAVAVRPAVVERKGRFVRYDYDGTTVHLIQSITRAKAGMSVGIVLDLGLVPQAGAKKAVFEIERGHIGETRLRVTGTDPVTGRPFRHTYVWDRIITPGRNVGLYDMPLWAAPGG